MLRNSRTVLLTHSKQRTLAVCWNQLIKALSSHSGKNNSCLDSAHHAGCAAVTYRIVYPGQVSPTCSVPSHIERPLYAHDNRLSRLLYSSWLSSKVGIEIKSEQQIRGMRDACRFYCCCCYAVCVVSYYTKKFGLIKVQPNLFFFGT